MASRDSDELRCRRAFFGRANAGITELYCRSCSRKRSREGQPVTVYHRWEAITPSTVVRIADRVVEGRPTPRRA